MKNKTFDCVKMKLDLQLKLYEQTKHLNLKELVEYIHKDVKETDLWQKLAIEKSNKE